MGRILKSGQECTLPAQLGQLKTGIVAKSSVVPRDLVRLWDRIEIENVVSPL